MCLKWCWLTFQHQFQTKPGFSERLMGNVNAACVRNLFWKTPDAPLGRKAAVGEVNGRKVVLQLKMCLLATAVIWWYGKVTCQRHFKPKTWLQARLTVIFCLSDPALSDQGQTEFFLHKRMTEGKRDLILLISFTPAKGKMWVKRIP